MTRKRGIFAAVLAGLMLIFPARAAAANGIEMSVPVTLKTNLNAASGKGAQNDSKISGRGSKNADENSSGKKNESNEETDEKTREQTEKEMSDPVLIMQGFSDKEVYNGKEPIVYTIRASQRAENACATGVIIRDRNPGGFLFDPDSVITSKGVTSIVGETDENGLPHQTLEVFVDRMEYDEDVIVTFYARPSEGMADENVSNTAVASCNELSYRVTDETKVRILTDELQAEPIRALPVLQTVRSVKTGNEAKIPLWYSLAAAAGAGIAFGLFVYRKRRTDHYRDLRCLREKKRSLKE